MCSAVAVAATTAKGRSFANAGGATDGSGLVAVAAQRPLLTPVARTHTATAAALVVGYDRVKHLSEKLSGGAFP